jgi:hypothetical protein
MSQPGDPAAGKNPTYGVPLHFLLKEGSENAEDLAVDDPAEADDEEESVGRVKLTVINSEGEVVRRLTKVPQGKGLHRVFWDLKSGRTRQVKLRTKALENPLIPLPDKGWRSLVDGGRLSLLVSPGTYTVRLEVDDLVHTQTVDVLRDPHSPGSAEDLQAQARVLRELFSLVDEAAAMINALEWTRKELLDKAIRLQGRPGLEEVHTVGRQLDKRLRELEGEFFDLRLTEASQDSLRWKRLFYSRLIYLAAGIERSDERPTEAQLEVFELYRQQMASHRRRFEGLRGEVDGFGRMLRDKGIGAVELRQGGR